MSTEQMNAEAKYSLTLSVFKRLREQGLLTAEEYARAERRAVKLYRPVLAGLCAKRP